jgi:DNA-binding CsgD family transcriptional regulator
MQLESDEDDHKAIIRLIEDETAAYFAKDYEGWERCWVHASYARRYGWYPRGGRLINIGWERESAEMKLSMQRYPEPNRSGLEIRRENMSIQIRGDTAWATYEQIAPQTGDAFDVPGRQHEVRILERHDGSWKIACCFVLGSAIEYVTSPLLHVDKDAVVLWINKAASEQLRNQGGLQINSGRLRAASRTDDQRLQASIRWAADLEAYTSRQMARSVVPTKYGALPVVLWEGSAPEVCWVIADGGMILVSFNDKKSREQRLEVAGVVYGISRGQMRVATLVVEGHDLVEAARRLDISVNTARTHMKRMFEKTGVSSQPTLVRVLLSVMSPLA